VQRVERDDGVHRGVVGVVPVLEGAGGYADAGESGGATAGEVGEGRA
jgi:hypothetical protein